MIVYEMCVLFFKMAADLRTWDDNCVDELCNLVFSHYLLGTMVRYSANDQVWEHITSTFNARTGKAFTKRGGCLGSSRLFDKGIAEPWGSLGMVIGATFPLGPLLTDCLMTRLNKRWMRSRSNLVHVPFDILLTYFVPIMFSSILSYGLPYT